MTKDRVNVKLWSNTKMLHLRFFLVNTLYYI